MKLRQVCPDDLPAIQRLEQENFARHEQIAPVVLAAYVTQNAANCLVMEDQCQVAGYLLSLPTASPRVEDRIFEETTAVSKDQPYLAIASLSIASAYQRQGLGNLLLAGLKEWALTQGYQGISLTCKDSLISYYEMNGFEDVGLSASQFGGEIWYDLYWKSLPDGEVLAF